MKKTLAAPLFACALLLLLASCVLAATLEVTASNVNVRSQHSILSSVAGKANRGEAYEIRGTYTPTKKDRRNASALANKDTDLIREDGSTLKLPKGTALLLVAPGGEESALAEVNLKGRKVRGTVYLLDVDLMTKPWYRISLRNGKEGWIYGEFVKAR